MHKNLAKYLIADRILTQWVKKIRRILFYFTNFFIIFTVTMCDSAILCQVADFHPASFKEIMNCWYQSML